MYRGNLFETTRRRILRLLLETRTPMTVDQIIAELGLPPSSRRVVYESLTHIARTLRRESGGKLCLMMAPPRCLNCGFVFSCLRRPRRPSRCPRCKSERIAPPAFIIREVE